MKMIAEFAAAERVCSHVDYRAVMKEARHNLVICVENFQLHSTEDNLRCLNSAWAFCVRLFKNLPPEGSPAPLSGAPEAARLAA